ncbi:hypothetical protein [Kitasatospora sp. NPDC002040]|uniref:hypothetical protein n=1 Tax=Kitasatospora sp. NPDC002040 TaxID=3154661 RepID=UPI00332D2F80
MPATHATSLTSAAVCPCSGTGLIPVPAKHQAALGNFLPCMAHEIPSHTVADDDVCPSCSGTLRVLDADGSICGTAGVLVPCGCVDPGQHGECACHIAEWDENDGFTGWSVIPLDEFVDDGPYFRRCSTHAPNLTRAMAVAA